MLSPRYLRDPEAITNAFKELISNAENSILIQMYLFCRNGDTTTLTQRDGLPPYTQPYIDLLISAKKRNPEIMIFLVLDSNTAEDMSLTRSRNFPGIHEQLRNEGICVLCANLFHNNLGSKKPFRQYTKLHLMENDINQSDWVHKQNKWQNYYNVEDHRKNLIIDGGKAAIITSHNLMDVSQDWFENGVLVTGGNSKTLWNHAVQSLKIAFEIPQRYLPSQKIEAESLPIYSIEESEVLNTESIFPALINLLSEENLKEVVIASAYFSDSRTLNILESIADQTKIRILVDSMDGLPLGKIKSFLLTWLINCKILDWYFNLPKEKKQNIDLRIFDSTSGRIMHLKTVLTIGSSKSLLTGQANLTPNSLNGKWLETDLLTSDPTIIEHFEVHFEDLWNMEEAVQINICTIRTKLKIIFGKLLLLVLAGLGLEP